MSVFPSSQATINLQVLPRFPAIVQGAGPVTISKSGLAYTFGLDFRLIAETDMPDPEALALIQDGETFWTTKLSALVFASIPDGSIADNRLAEMPAHTVKANPTDGGATPTNVELGSTLSFSAGNLITEAFTGDVSSTPNSFFLTITPEAVTNTKLSKAPAFTVKGNPTNGEAAVQDVTLGSTLAFSGTALQTGAGTGDVTWSANSFSTTIANGVVTNAKLANATQATVKGRAAGAGTGSPQDLTASQVLDMLGSTQGQVLYRDASGWVALAPGSVGQVLTTFGPGGNPAWTTFTASVSDPWAAMPIGVPIAVFDDIPGVSVPPTDKAYRYVNLTAGLTGSGGYNQGILTNETVSGSAPLVNATAVINLPASPMHGQTIRLIGTERRFIRAGASGTTQDDAMQGHRHPPLSGQFLTRNSGPNGGSGSTISDHSTTGDPVTDGANGTPRVANETRPRNIGATYYMRIW